MTSFLAHHSTFRQHSCEEALFAGQVWSMECFTGYAIFSDFRSLFLSVDLRRA